MKNIIIFTLVLTSQLALAGEKGNGGDAVVCRDAESVITRATVLDLSEMIQGPGVSLKSEEEMNSFINLKVASLMTCRPSLFSGVAAEAARLSLAIDSYLQQGVQTDAGISFVESLGDITDSKHSNDQLPNNCQVEQLVKRLDDPSLHTSTYQIASPILEKLDYKNRAAIILHEAVYKAMHLRGRHNNSFQVRRLVAQLFEGPELTKATTQGLCRN